MPTNERDQFSFIHNISIFIILVSAAAAGGTLQAGTLSATLLIYQPKIYFFLFLAFFIKICGVIGNTH